MKIMTVVGARPQFIKAAVVSRALRGYSDMHEVLVHTGQHYDDNMSDVFFEELEITAPNRHLGIGSELHGTQTGRMLEAVEGVIRVEQPDWVLVYGDTNSTLAGALAAAKLHIPVAHVEAGLRSFNRRMPEEINRVLTDHAADLLFVPTETAVSNLKSEGLAGDTVALVGDVMYDAALYYAGRAESHDTILDRFGVKPKHYVLATVHRAENTDDPETLRSVFAGLDKMAERCPVILPLHPRTRKSLDEAEINLPADSGLTVTDPLGYLDMTALEKNALMIATDSGGVQKEAFFHRVPCATLRSETEWVELVEHGYNRLVGSDPDALLAALSEFSETPPDFRHDLYGDGNAGTKIVERLRCGSG